MKKLLRYKLCPICDQPMDIEVTSHKNSPFVDNKTYSTMCFTCYSAPKIMKQKYDNNGYILEEIEIEYDISNLYSPKELFEQGSADSIKYAKNCVDSIKKLKVIKNKNKKCKPELKIQLP